MGTVVELKYESKNEHAPENENIFRTYRDGAYFGEKALMLNLLRLSTTKAKTLSTVLILSKHEIGRIVGSSYDVAISLKKIMRSTIELSLSREQMASAQENPNFRTRGQQKVYSMLLSKARSIRKNGSGRGASLNRTQSAFEVKSRKKKLDDSNNGASFLDDVTDTIVDDMGDE